MNRDKDFYKDVYGQDFDREGISSGWIQWKGTQVCIDLHCVCGYHGHIDEDFFYAYECASCGRKFAVGQNVKLIELTPEQAEQMGHEFYKDDEDLAEFHAQDVVP